MDDEMMIVREYGKRLPVDVKGLIERLGIAYVEEPMEPSSSGRIDYNDPFCTITVNSSERPQRRRFTAAHELGHYLLHRDLLDGRHLDRLFGGPVADNPYAPLHPQHEVQANQFAAGLLMPKDVLQERYDAKADNFLALSRLCDVSPAAMKIRLEALGIRSKEIAA